MKRQKTECGRNGIKLLENHDLDTGDKLLINAIPELTIPNKKRNLN